MVSLALSLAAAKDSLRKSDFSESGRVHCLAFSGLIR